MNKHFLFHFRCDHSNGSFDNGFRLATFCEEKPGNFAYALVSVVRLWNQKYEII